MSCVSAGRQRVRLQVIFIPPCYTAEAVEAVSGSPVRVGIPIGFPLGGHATGTRSPKPWKECGRAHPCWTW